MKRYLLSGLFVLAFAFYAGYQYLHPSNTAADLTNFNPAAPIINTAAPVSSGFKNGAYTGSAEDAFYGTVQVRATISGGKISNIEFLQYPNDRGHSIEVSTMAIPRLRSEAIAAQSANVDVVSGATQTSEAFMRSLQSALAQA
jgi:uncharacterized protein with FMN-binding domain